MKESKIIPKILEILQSGAEATAQIFDIFTSGYSESYRKAHRYARQRLHFSTDWAEDYRSKQRFYSLLNKLKRDGLVKKNSSGRQSRWTITKTGLIKLAGIKKVNEEERKLNDGLWRIVIFDVPEKERPKRIWLRSALTNNNFKMLQKSVWIGKRKLPEKFILSLKQKQMITYVYIFEVGKTGTLHEII